MPSLIDIRRRDPRGQDDAADHQGDEDGRRVEAAPRAGADHAARGRSRVQMQRVLDSVASRVDPSIHPLLDERASRAPSSRTLRHRRHRATRACAAASTPTSSRRPARFIVENPARQVALGLVGRHGPRLLRAARLRGALRAGRPVPGSCSSTTRRRSRSAAIEAFIERPGRQRLPRLQRVQVGDVAARRRRAAAADPARRRSTPARRRAGRRRRCRLPVRADAARRSSTQLLPRYVEVQVYRALLESNAAFYAAQMTAMDAATRNSADMIEQPDALHEQGPPGGDHARDHRSGLGRASAVEQDSELERIRRRHGNSNSNSSRRSARSSRSSARSSTSSSRAATCPRSTTPSASWPTARAAGDDRRHRRSRAAPRREPRPHRRDEADRRHAARHEGDRHSARRSRCRSGRRRSAAC